MRSSRACSRKKTKVRREGLDAFELVGTDVHEVFERRLRPRFVVQLIYKNVHSAGVKVDNRASSVIDIA
jgi:hypothetical protein